MLQEVKPFAPVQLRAEYSRLVHDDQMIAFTPVRTDRLGIPIKLSTVR